MQLDLQALPQGDRHADRVMRLAMGGDVADVQLIVGLLLQGFVHGVVFEHQQGVEQRTTEQALNFEQRAVFVFTQAQVVCLQAA
ncbi:hypothetical protein D3C76_1595990 [compost metagenome]